MGHLGSFGAAVRELDPLAEKDSFTFFGETFTVVDTLPPMLMLQLGAATTGKIEEQEGLGAVWEALRCSLTAPETYVERGGGKLEVKPADESQFHRFYRLAVARKATLEELLKVAMALFQGQSGRPTEGLPDSSAGQPTTSPSSSISSSTPPASPDSAPSPYPGMRSVSEVLSG